mmetsp:Transcript_45665/g.108749  ORF Transcript_45665/g.108749 Transcript_45665/m.108749 type:complete len:248 (-) Transcript_45665:193-936(-)
MPLVAAKLQRIVTSSIEKLNPVFAAVLLRHDLQDAIGIVRHAVDGTVAPQQASVPLALHSGQKLVSDEAHLAGARYDPQDAVRACRNRIDGAIGGHHTSVPLPASWQLRIPLEDTFAIHFLAPGAQRCHLPGSRHDLEHSIGIGRYAIDGSSIAVPRIRSGHAAQPLELIPPQRAPHAVGAPAVADLVNFVSAAGAEAFGDDFQGGLGTAGDGIDAAVVANSRPKVLVHSAQRATKDAGHAPSFASV